MHKMRRDEYEQPPAPNELAIVPKKEPLVEKRNILNTALSSLSLNQQRLFAIYLSKINARDTSTKNVTISLSEYRDLMELNHVNINEIRKEVEGLVTKTFYVFLEPGDFEDEKYVVYLIFKKCTFTHLKEKNDWIIELSPNDDVLPLLFNYKSKYVTYRISNITNFRSRSQLALYELLKQHELQGVYEVDISYLRARLNIKEGQYTAFKDFRVRVLDSCCNAINKYSDIHCEYKRGEYGKSKVWHTVIFTIHRKESNIIDITDRKAIEISDRTEDNSSENHLQNSS